MEDLVRPLAPRSFGSKLTIAERSATIFAISIAQRSAMFPTLGNEYLRCGIELVRCGQQNQRDRWSDPYQGVDYLP